VHLDQEHQQNQSDEELSEQTENSKRGHARKETILKNKHIEKNIPTLYCRNEFILLFAAIVSRLTKSSYSLSAQLVVDLFLRSALLV
jgi:hypothetical protein